MDAHASTPLEHVALRPKGPSCFARLRASLVKLSNWLIGSGKRLDALIAGAILRTCDRLELPTCCAG